MSNINNKLKNRKMIFMELVLAGTYPFLNEEPVGGAAMVLRRLERGLEMINNDISVRIITRSNNCKKKWLNHENKYFVKIPKFKLGSIYLSTYPLNAKKLLQSINFDVINSHSIDFAYYSIENSKKVLFTLHGITWEEKNFKSWYKQPGWNFFYVKRLHKLLDKLKYFVSINPYAKKMIKEKTDAKIFDIENPVDEIYFDIENRSDKFRFLYLGSIGKRKNLLTLIKALPIVKNEVDKFHLHVCGKINDESYYEKIEKYIDKKNLEEHVELHGLINKEEKLKQFSKMNFLILPSLQETAPLVISEAFAAGKPVIASNLCGIPYMIGNDKRGLLVDPKNEKDIAKKIIYLLQNNSVSKKMGEKAKLYARKKNHPKVVAKKYIKAYRFINNNR